MAKGNYRNYGDENEMEEVTEFGETQQKEEEGRQEEESKQQEEELVTAHLNPALSASSLLLNGGVYHPNTDYDVDAKLLEKENPFGQKYLVKNNNN